MPVIGLIRILLFAIYAPIVLLVYWRLYPRLSPMSKRLATFMLAAQLLAITLATIFVDDIGFIPWLWHLDLEFNMPSTLASAQLALVGLVALLTAWLAKPRAAWQRIYFVGISILFFHFARDEFYQFRDPFAGWKISYAQLGIVVALVTAMLSLRIPRQQRNWCLSILAGLAIGALGAFFIEDLRHEEICTAYGFMAGKCLIYFLEEALEFLGMWLVLVGVLGFYSETSPNVGTRWRIVYLLPILWILIHHAPYIIRYAEYTSDGAVSAATHYESGMELRITRLDHDQSGISLQFYAAPRKWQDLSNLGFSIHLIDQVSGASLAGVNASARRNRVMPYGYFHNLYVYKQQLDVDFPASIPPNQALWIVMTSWKQDGDQFTRQQVRSSDFPTLSDTQVILSELVLPTVAMPAEDHHVARFVNGLVLERVTLPIHTKAGDTLSISFTWRSGSDAIKDLMQFLHFRDLASGKWWVYDQLPLGPRLPTRLWYSGLADSEIWQVPVPIDLRQGEYAVYTGLYRASDNERLVSKAVDGTTFAEARVPLGNLTIINQQ